jgi:hypothetical protein
MDSSLPVPAGPSRLLLDLAEERLDPGEVETVELWLRAEGLTATPPWVRRRAERLAGRSLPARRPDFSWPTVRRVIASLAFDSAMQPQFVGMRASQTRVRRLLFQAESIEVDLEMTPVPSSEQVRVSGQVTAGGADPSGGMLRLSKVADERQAQLSESGEFWLEDLDPGAYRLEIELDNRVVEVSSLPI